MKPDAWSSPRAYRDPALRSQHYGPLVPLAANDNHPRSAVRWAAVMGFVFALLAGVFVVPALGRIFA